MKLYPRVDFAFLARAERYTAETLPEELSGDPVIKKAMEVLVEAKS